MKVISLLQPWATLVVIGAKKIETRSWNTSYRGPILIHASAGQKPSCREMTLDFQQEFYHLQLPNYKDMPFGAIIGKVDLVHTVQSEVCFEGNEFEWIDYSRPLCPTIRFTLTHQEIEFGDYSPNRFGWLLTDPEQFASPIPAKGQLRIWNYDMPDRIHIPIVGGGHATFLQPPDSKTLDAVTEMIEIAKRTVKYDRF